MYPIVVVLFDGLADRAHDVLKGRTGNEAARTPNLDRLAARSSCGVLYAVGPGRAPSSEVAHWSMLGYRPEEFPGTRRLRGSRPRPAGVGRARLRLRRVAARGTSRRRLVVDRPAGPEARRRRRPGARRGVRRPRGRQAGLLARRTSGAAKPSCASAGEADDRVTDSDAFFRDRHPVLRPLPLVPEAERTARAVEEWTRWTMEILAEHEINQRRADAGLPCST